MKSCAGLGALVCLLAGAPARADVSGPEIVGYLNAQRSAQGVPAGIVEDAALSDGCAKHNAYDRINGVLSHGEDPSRQGYTPEGDQAGQKSVLYAGSGPWTSIHDPLETAPIHLHQLLAPRLDRMGASENQGYGCATTLASRNRPAPPSDVTYTYPGDGAAAWPVAQTASEGPYTPGERVGIPAGTTTGPYLYVMFDGPDLTPFDSATATSATLVGPEGSLDVAVVDNHTSGLEPYLPTGMEVIPRAPLRPDTTYTASVAASVSTQGGGGPTRTFSRTWSFATGALGNTVRVTGTATSGRQIGVWVSSDAPGATVTATGPGTTTSQTVGTDGKATLNLDADGTWQICARSGGSGSQYAAAEDCVSVSVRQQPPGGSTGFSVGNTGHSRGGRPFGVAVPSRVRRGGVITVAITSTPRFFMQFTLSSPRGRVLLRYARHPLSGGRTWSFRLRVPAPYNRRGRAVRLRMLIDARGRRYTVRRTVRFR